MQRDQTNRGAGSSPPGGTPPPFEQSGEKSRAGETHEAFGTVAFLQRGARGGESSSLPPPPQKPTKVLMYGVIYVPNESRILWIGG